MSGYDKLIFHHLGILCCVCRYINDIFDIVKKDVNFVDIMPIINMIFDTVKKDVILVDSVPAINGESKCLKSLGNLTRKLKIVCF